MPKGLMHLFNIEFVFMGRFSRMKVARKLREVLEIAMIIEREEQKALERNLVIMEQIITKCEQKLHLSGIGNKYAFVFCFF